MSLRDRLTRRRPAPTFTCEGNCDIREHTGDGYFVGRCDFPIYEGFCPRHGRLSDYPDRDDRAVDPRDRDFGDGPLRDHLLGRR